MPNNGAVAGSIAGKDEQYTVPRGFHDGSGKVGIASAEKAKLIPENIRQGVTVMGVEGSMSSTEGANPQAKEVTPTTDEQQILPDAEQGYNYLSQVTVKPIPYSETENSAGGLTAMEIDKRRGDGNRRRSLLCIPVMQCHIDRKRQYYKSLGEI